MKQKTGADQLHGYCTADLHLYFCIYTKNRFSHGAQILKTAYNKGADQIRWMHGLVLATYVCIYIKKVF